MNLRSPKVESVATFLELRSDPNAGANAIDVLTPNLDDARQTADRLRKLPEVNSVMTLDTFVPSDQEQKLTYIRALAKALEPAFKAPGATCPVGRGQRRGDQPRYRCAEEGGRGPGRPRRRRRQPPHRRGCRSSPAATRRCATERTAALVPPLKTAIKGMRLSLEAPADHGRQPAAGHQGELDHVRWPRPRRGPSQRRCQRQRGAADFARAVLAAEPRAIG